MSISHTSAAGPGVDHRRVAERLVIAGCSARKTPSDTALAAFELYAGGCVPRLRARLGWQPELRGRVRFLSAEHGFITADTPVHAYELPLDPVRAHELRRLVARQLHQEFTDIGVPAEVLIIVEPLYLVLIADLLALPERPRIHWVPDHTRTWADAATVLDRWGW